MLPQQRPQQTVGIPAFVPAASHTTSGDDGPACLSCRRRKLRCSREFPSCTQCMRLSSECVYNKERQRPGLKPGAIENISRRLELLEQRLEDLDRVGSSGEFTAVDPSDVRGCVYHASLLLASHLRDEASNKQPSSVLASLPSGTRTAEDLNCGRPVPTTGHQGLLDGSDRGFTSNKRRRMKSPEGRSNILSSRFGDLPSQVVVNAAISKYFATAHHWIPMLHERRFRARLEDTHDSRNLTILLHAILVIALKHLDFVELGIDSEACQKQVRVSTDVVILHAMEHLTIENAQALIMLCFDRMGSGEWPKAWSILGSLVRTVDYLGLTVEPDAPKAWPLLSPLTLLKESTSHAETEERKRVFWNTFLLDRLCSITTAWSTGFTSDNVSRRLPCNGGKWRRSEEATTPYFGIWERKYAKIGQPVAYLSSQGQPLVGTPPLLNISHVGALAYRIEATESLSQVSSFFLQQSVDFTNRNELSQWLTRFKELDLRLVHWKEGLPDRWKESNVSQDAIIRMDPNLTLAHVTHNTSMILLHQHIAHPCQALTRMIKLPSACSAETCELAAIETSGITSKYLRHTPDMFVNAEFVFCVYTASRVLLVHSQYYKTELSPEFFTLVNSLDEMGRRWEGWQTAKTDPAASNLAAQYAAQLREYHSRCQNSHNDTTVLAHLLFGPDRSQTGRFNGEIAVSENIDTSGSGVMVTPMHFPRQDSYSVPPIRRSNATEVESTPSTSQNRVTKPPVYGYYGEVNSGPTIGSYGSPSSQDNLMAMCDTLLGQGFTDLDRIIPVEGTDFSFNTIDMQDYRFGFNSS